MCARYTLRTSPKILAEHLGVTDLPLFTARFNVAPTQSVLAVRQRQDEREGVLFRWGLIPSWSKDAKMGVRCLNARADTVADKPAFRHAFMPVILPSEHYQSWLAPSEDARALLPLLRPFPAERMEAVAANPYVNNSRNEGPACLEPFAC